MEIIRGTLEKKRPYCSAAFLDITQAFDKILASRPLVQNQKNPSPCILQNITIISNGYYFKKNSKMESKP
jgi:hypothetical protein